jgi:hypothetical protein
MLGIVTLILGMSKPDGIYLSVDYLVTDSRTGALIDDASVKHLQVTYPPDQTGPRALLAYTGLAILPDGTPTGTWIRETLRGETEVFDVSMRHLGERLERDIARHRQPLIINVLVVQGERRFLGAFSNVRKTTFEVNPHFGYHMQELEEPFAFANGSGAARVQAGRHHNKMVEQLRIKPRKPMDHMNLLAAINRRVASFEDTVSPYCHVAYLPSNAGDEPGPQSRVFTKPGESVPFAMPTILFGVDLSHIAEHFHAQTTRTFAGEDRGPDLDPDVVNEHLKRRQ